MDSSEFSSMEKPPPRKELQLQGPRPSPLKLHKDSHKVKKQPMAHGVGPSRTHHPLPSQQQTRAPVIIYMASPKVIHTEPDNFMTLVQQLTGASPATSSATTAEAPSLAAPPSGYPSPSAPGDILPPSHIGSVQLSWTSSGKGEAMMAGVADSAVDAMDQDGNFPGIVPSLPPSADFFSPLGGELASLAFLDDIAVSPVFHDDDRSSVEGSADILSSPAVFSPGAFYDPFNQVW